MILLNKIGTNLETQLLEDRHMSSPKLFYLHLPNFILKPVSQTCVASPCEPWDEKNRFGDSGCRPSGLFFHEMHANL